MPLTPEEAAGLKGELGAAVDRYIGTSPSPGPSPTPPPTPEPTPPPSGWVKLEWRADGNNSSLSARSPCRAYFKVPDNAKSGGGRVLAKYTSSAVQNDKTMVLSATPGGPPLALWANAGGRQPQIVFYVGASPADFYNPPLSRGATYYVTIDNNPPVAADVNTNIVIDLDTP